MSAAPKLSQEKIFSIAEDVGLNLNLLRQDMELAAIDAYLYETAWLALKLGIWTTPAFVIGNAFVPTRVSAGQLKALVAHARNDRRSRWQVPANASAPLLPVLQGGTAAQVSSQQSTK